jgi:hypothetical protein
VITTGTLDLNAGTIQMTGGAGTNPLMVASLVDPANGTAINVQCGSALPCATTPTYKVSFAVVRNHFDAFGQASHQELQCRLFVPVYTMYSKYEENYLAQGSKRIFYKGVQYKGLLNKLGTRFQNNLQVV